MPAPRRVDPTINIGVRRQIRYAKLWKEYERQMVSAGAAPAAGCRASPATLGTIAATAKRGCAPRSKRSVAPAAMPPPPPSAARWGQLCPEVIMWEQTRPRTPRSRPAAEPGLPAKGARAPVLPQRHAGARGAPQVRRLPSLGHRPIPWQAVPLAGPFLRHVPAGAVSTLKQRWRA